MTTTPGILDIIPLPEKLEDLPDPDPFYWAVGKDEHYLVKRFLYGKAIVRVKQIDHLPETKGMLWHGTAPKVPAELMSQIWSFFRHIFATKGSESMVYLTYKQDEGYRVFVPPQTASIVHVSAKIKLEHIAEGWLLAGTVHSHCDFNGFHSGTDEKDAREHDGLHMTIGHVDKTEPEIAAMIAVGGTLFDMDYENVIDGDLDPTATHPSYWNHFVQGEVERPKPKARPPVQPMSRPYGSWQYGDDEAWKNWRKDRHPVYGHGKTLGFTESSFTDLVDTSIRNSMFEGSTEDELMDWAGHMDARLTDLEDEAREMGIEIEFNISRPLGSHIGRLVGASGQDYASDARDAATPALLGDAQEVDDFLASLGD